MVNHHIAIAGLFLAVFIAGFAPSHQEVTFDELEETKGKKPGHYKKGDAMRERLQNFRNKIDEPAFNQEILEIHNKLRATHSAPDLVLSETLCNDAKEEAKLKAAQWAANGKFDTANDPDRSYNDNVWATLSISTTKVRPEKVMSAWLAEEKKHDYKTNYFQDKSGHFTQMIWKSTDEIGVGFAVNRTLPGTDPKKNRKYIYVVVVRYTPPGNILDTDAFSENISPS